MDTDDETTPESLLERAKNIMIGADLSGMASFAPSAIMADDAIDAALRLLREANKREKEERRS